MNLSDQCLHCWRSGPERDGCNCVLELLPRNHPDNPHKQPGWYHTMSPDFAWDNYGFPPDPEKGWEMIAEDGSYWQFDIHGQGHWDLMNYAPGPA